MIGNEIDQSWPFDTGTMSTSGGLEVFQRWDRCVYI